VYWLLIALSAGMMLGRILSVDSVDMVGIEKDRVKKIPAELAVRKQKLEATGMVGEALEKELARIEDTLRKEAKLRRPFLSANDRSRLCTVRALVEEDLRVPGAPYAIDKVIQQRNWDTIDMVQHGGHLYSSKPPLFATVMAGVYWPIYHYLDITLGTHPHAIGRFLLVVFNLFPMIVYFVLLAKLIDRFGTTDWGRLFAMTAAAFATFLTTFSVTVNNHIPAAVCVVIALYPLVRIVFDGERRLRYFAIAGFFSALAVTNELPAATFAAMATLAAFWKSPRNTVLGFAPAALVVVAAFFGTNWVAHDTWRLAYSHRTGPDNWYDYTYERNGKQIESYWRNPVGVDLGEPSWTRYAVNVLVGHHGIFSLTPIWILSLIGALWWMAKSPDPRLRWMAIGIAAASLTCLTFYLTQPQVNRNYGGVTSGLRWMFWFAPLWLLAMLPTLDAMASRRWIRGLALILLALSVLSASYPTWNPWTQPWMMDYLQYMERVS
jgi:hypothetical protein